MDFLVGTVSVAYIVTRYIWLDQGDFERQWLILQVPVGILAGHLDGLTYIDPRGDGRYLITNSKDQVSWVVLLQIMSFANLSVIWNFNVQDSN